MKTITLIFIMLCISITMSNGATWKYKKWETEKVDKNMIKLTTQGEVAYGNQFGFIKTTDDCKTNNLWLTIWTFGKHIVDFKGKLATVQVKVDDVKFEIKLRILTVVNFSPHNSESHVAIFSNFIASDKFINLLKKGHKISFDIIAPTNLVKNFDIPHEAFDLDGFTTNYIKAMEVCKNSAILNIVPNIE